jgi:hypothetical protein
MPRIVQQPVIDALLLRRHVDRVQDGGVLLGPFRASLPSSARRIGIGCIVCLAAATRIAIWRPPRLRCRGLAARAFRTGQSHGADDRRGWPDNRVLVIDVKSRVKRRRSPQILSV